MNQKNSAEDSSSTTSSGCCDNRMGLEKMKTLLADKLHHYAEKLSRTADADAECGLAQQKKQFSVWLEKSADCVRQFDYERTDARIRDSVKRHPGRTLLIAGAVGLVLGAIFRRR